ncbi:prolyl oligopeptidase family serine peptidase [Kutzneria sp. NPDC052558]|uniref:prolyl oligopeptidase family serine peptidase n=1 Tax=Kutzneria sp. NPDC052558 TaxID=3364121 RepID=UPI0037CADAA7
MTRPQIREATSIAPSDTSTSTVLKPDVQRQIQLRDTPLTTYTDVPYAEPGLKYDLFVPEGAGPWPLVVYATGGGFIMADKSNGLRLRNYLAENGFAVATIEYQTVLQGGAYTDGIAQVRAAVEHLRANADKYGIDPAKVALWGESAGGYLVTRAGLEPDLNIKAVVTKFGAIDFAGVADDFDDESKAGIGIPGHPLAQYLHGPGTTKTVHDAVPDANPLNHITADAPAFQLWHGSADAIISPSQTLKLHNALRAAGVDSTRYVIEGTGHGDLAILLGRPEDALPWSTEEVVGLSVDFLREHL